MRKLLISCAQLEDAHLDLSQVHAVREGQAESMASACSLAWVCDVFSAADRLLILHTPASSQDFEVLLH